MIESGFKSRAGNNGARTVYTPNTVDKIIKSPNVNKRQRTFDKKQQYFKTRAYWRGKKPKYNMSTELFTMKSRVEFDWKSLSQKKI